MLKTFRDAWKIPEIRSKMIFTILMFVVYRFGAAIPVPFMNKDAIAELFNRSEGSILSLLDLMAGGSLSQFTIFAASIYPYITASIVIQLLTVAIPSLEALSKEGDTGRKIIAKYTRYLAVVLATVQAAGTTFGIYGRALEADTLIQKIVVILSIVGGTMFLVWLGEQITEKGIGNGISLIIFAGIISRFPHDVISSVSKVRAGEVNPIYLAVFVIITLLIVFFVVALNEGERRIPVQYAKRVIGRKMYGGQSTHIPIKVLMSGVMPIIFANSIMAIPQTITLFYRDGGFGNWITKWLTPAGGPGIWIYSILSVLMIIFFTFFYTAIQFNTVEYSKNLQQNGGFIPGIRPGRSTSDYLNKTVNRLVFPGAIALSILTILPTVLSKISGMQFNYGGTSIIIIVGVILETARVLDQQLLMRHYKGFLK